MIKINLLKPEKKEVVGGGEQVSLVEETRTGNLNVPAIVAALVIALGLIGFLYLSQSNALDKAQKNLEARRARKAELDQVLKQLAEVEQTKLQLDSKIKIITELKQRQKNSVIMMDKLSRALPEYVWLSNLSFNNQTLLIGGNAFSNNLIADFINNLQNSNHFVEIKLQSSVRKKVGGQEIFDFKIICQFKQVIEANKVG